MIPVCSNCGRTRSACVYHLWGRGSAECRKKRPQGKGGVDVRPRHPLGHSHESWVDPNVPSVFPARKTQEAGR